VYSVTISMRAADAASAELLRRESIAVCTPSRSEPGCLFFDVLFDESDPLLVRFYEAYVDQAAFETHLTAPHTRAWVRACIPVVDRSTIRNPESVATWSTTPPSATG
jgi:quinol monooxygenase YgiN